jgi:GTPase SAR1 family protein
MTDQHLLSPLAGSPNSSIHESSDPTSGTSNTQHISLNVNPLTALLGADTNKIFDLVDQLRRKGIKEEVPLPQIIVIGDQSSGKSSVLEAISRQTFPRGEKLCTTFATELALRRKPVSQVCVSIQPAADRPDHEKEQLRSWKPQSMDLQEFQKIVKDAGKEITSLNHGFSGSYSRDVLRIEISGPDQHQLTLVDLPGIIQRKNVNQDPGDPIKVREIVESYMADPASIILAVVSAEIEQARQETLNLVEKHDRLGTRTVGVITKPDRALPDSAVEREYILMAENAIHEFKYGWYVLKNRGHKSDSWSAEQRDSSEAYFFKTSNWGMLSRSQLGATSLRNALRDLLDAKIRAALPNIGLSIEANLKTLKSQLRGLGMPRTSDSEKRNYLDGIARQFEKLVRESVDGSKSGLFDAKTSTGYKTLRSNIHALNDVFIHELRNCPFSQMIMGPAITPIASDPLAAVKTFKIEQEIVEQVSAIHVENRGSVYIPNIVDRTPLISFLFQKVTEPWKVIADNYIQTVSQAVRSHFTAIAKYTAGERMAKDLQKHCLEEALAIKENQLQQKLDELYAPYYGGHPSTRSPVFCSAHQSLLASVGATKETGNDRRDFELAIRETALYYQVCALFSDFYVSLSGFERL